MNKLSPYVREYAVHAVLLTAALFLLFPDTLLGGEIIVPGELLYKYAPWDRHTPPDTEIPTNWLTQDALSAFNVFYFLVESSFEKGEWPLWNNMQFTGAPLLANYQTAVFYPPRLLHRIVDHYIATTLFILLKFFLCGMTAYICGRGLGRSIWASRFLSLAWMFCLYNVTWCLWPLPDVSAWLPLMFLAVEFLLTRRYRRGFSLLIFSATLFMLAGHPETALTMAAFLGLYFALRLAATRVDIPRKVAIAGLAWGIVLLICAVQLLPFLEYLPNSFTLENRPTSDEGVAYSVPLSGAILFWVPRFFGMMTDENYWATAPANSNYSALFYVGMMSWVLAVVGIATGKRVQAVCLGVPAIISLLLVFDTPLNAAVKSLPLLDSTRSGYFAGFGLFAILLFASSGIDNWFSARRTVREAYPAIGTAGAIAIAAIASYFLYVVAIHEAGVSQYVLVQAGIGIAFAAAGVAVLILGGTQRIPKSIAQVLIAALLVADLAIASRGIVPTSPRASMFPETQLTNQALALDQPARIRILPTFAPIIPPGFVTPYGIEQYHGYEAILPARFMHYMSLMAIGGWDKMSRVVAIDQIWTRDDVPMDVAGVEFVEEIEGVRIYREPEAFERAFLVGRARAIAPWSDLLNATLDENYDPSREILADWLPKGELPQTDSNELGIVQFEFRTPNTVGLSIDVSAPCYLVLADAYFPGWEATVDGVQTEIFPAYHAFRGIIVSEGQHTVEFSYRPQSFRYGLIISIIALAASALFATVLLLRLRHQASRLKR